MSERPTNAAAAWRRGVSAVALVLAVLGPLAGVANADQTVLANGQRKSRTAIVAYDSESALRSATVELDGARRRVDGLVRWGEPAATAEMPALVLTDGSRLLTDKKWSPAGVIKVEGDRVRLRRGSSWIDAPRSAVTWAVFDSLTPLDGEDNAAGDALVLRTGDRVAGRVVSLGAKMAQVEAAGQPIETPRDAIAAIRFAAAQPPAGEAVVLVGLSDGSLLRARRVQLADDQVRVVTVSGVEVVVPTAALALMQPVGAGVAYLSDLEPVDYRHTPYLDLVWPYARDVSLRGGPLAGGGRRAAKGLAVHSAARLVYRLDESITRFQSQVAVADAGPGRAEGSVVCRVFLIKDGGFTPAYDSGVVRSGDAALTVDVDTTGAAAIALIVDYADRGDAGDEALWLDARLISAP